MFVELHPKVEQPADQSTSPSLSPTVRQRKGEKVSQVTPGPSCTTPSETDSCSYTNHCDNPTLSDSEYETPVHNLYSDLDTEADQSKALKTNQTERELDEEEEDNYDEDGNRLPERQKSVIVRAEELAQRIWHECWEGIHHIHLPDWLQDNEFLHQGHRPQLNSFYECFKSVFRVHTETGNIWTHLLGFITFIAIAIYFLSRPALEVQWQEKAVFSAFFLGAIICLGFSWIMHTVHCHSENVGKLFNKLDYCGIALLTMGSFVPWLYYSFYCKLIPKIVYIVLIFVLGSTAIFVSLWDKFAQPRFRPLRAGTFIALGLSGVIPALHFVITDGFWHAVHKAALGWLALMAVLYISGALIYAARIPERIFPGKFDIWFQSHQIFHVFVIAAALVHYHGITKIANYRLTHGDCHAGIYIPHRIPYEIFDE